MPPIPPVGAGDPPPGLDGAGCAVPEVASGCIMNALNITWKPVVFRGDAARLSTPARYRRQQLGADSKHVRSEPPTHAEKSKRCAERAASRVLCASRTTGHACRQR